MISLEAFSELLAVLYSTPLHPERWEVFLELLCRHTNSRSSFLMCADNRAGLSVRVQGGVRLPASTLENYATKYAQSDPFVLPLIRSGKTGVIDCEDLLPRIALEATDMYRHLLVPSGYSYPGLMALTCTVRRFEVISFWRTAKEGHLDSDAVRLLDMLVPHMQSTLAIRQALGVADVQIAGMQAMIDASTTATFLLSSEGEVLHANAAAAELLREDDGLILRDGRLDASVGRMRKQMRSLLQQAMPETNSLGKPPKALPLALERLSGRMPLRLLASPVQAYGLAQTRVEGSGGVLLLVTDPEKPVVLRDDVLRTHYGFTTAETDVANGLLTRYSLEEVAALRRVKVGTVRHQVKSILAKTGTGRQTELVRLLLSLPRQQDRYLAQG